MEKTRLRIVAFVGMLVLGTSEVSRAEPVGTAFTYQGQLKESGGPANGTYDFQFALYDGSGIFDNLVAGPLTLDDEQVDNGLFTVQLDFGNVYDGTALWLWVLVRPGDSTGQFTQIWPRQPLTATPFALYALNGGGGGGGNTLDESYDQGGPGVGGIITADAGPVEIAGPDGLTVNGNVGIGTTNPAEKLDVAGTAQMTGFKLPTGATDGYMLVSDASGVGTWQPGGGGAPTGPAGGDLGGTYPNPIVERLQGRAMSGSLPGSGDVLGWNGGTWIPSVDSLQLPFSGTLDDALKTALDITNIGTVGDSPVARFESHSFNSHCVSTLATGEGSSAGIFQSTGSGGDGIVAYALSTEAPPSMLLT